jgi:hypothetical protein
MAGQLDPQIPVEEGLANDDVIRLNDLKSVDWFSADWFGGRFEDQLRQKASSSRTPEERPLAGAEQNGHAHNVSLDPAASDGTLTPTVRSITHADVDYVEGRLVQYVFLCMFGRTRVLMGFNLVACLSGITYLSVIILLNLRVRN